MTPSKTVDLSTNKHPLMERINFMRYKPDDRNVKTALGIDPHWRHDEKWGFANWYQGSQK